jgi:hypothetical protein
MDVVRHRLLSFIDSFGWALTSVGFALPFTLNGITFPGFWENFANEKLVKVQIPIIETHPPSSF